LSLAVGSRLGPYEILSPLGAGGMGEVYRARDTRLKRDVALKVLVGAAGEDSGRFRRFQTEAESTAALAHPNIVAVYDIGHAGDAPYIVSELVSGGTMTSLLARGPLPAKKLLDLAVPIAEGLAAAHAAGIVHRDLKPDNILLTSDGAPKIADFGLAKYFRPDQEAEGSQLTTLTDDRTKEGTIVGTISYMSPEQAKGEAVDYRSDQFSFGSVLYEMATGRRAFRKTTAVQTLAAIVEDEPEPVSALAPKTPAPLRWIVERCHAKEPRQRYASTEDLARDLTNLRNRFTEMSGTGGAAVTTVPRYRRLRNRLVLAALVVAAAAAGYLARPAARQVAIPSFQRLTFRRGHISGARFSPDGNSIVYSAAWDGKPLETFLARRESADSRSLGLAGAHLFSVSSAAEMAVGLRWGLPSGLLGVGTLARASISGGAPRELLEKVLQADWAPDGKSLAVARRKQGRAVLEFPIGKTLCEVNSPWDIRVSPKSDLVAVIEEGAGRSSIVVVDNAGKKRTLSTGWNRAHGLAWTPTGDEVWFTGSRSGQARALWAISLSGRERLLARVPGRLTLEDIASDGRVLMTHENVRREMVGLPPGQGRERDLTWLGYSFPNALSADGRMVLFTETDESSPLSALYVRGTDGSPAVRIGEAGPMTISAFSPDNRWVVARQPDGRGLQLLPTGAGEARPLPIPGLEETGDIRWFPDGEHLLVEARVPGEGYRDFVIDLAGAKPRALTPQGISESVISADGKSILNLDEQGGLSIYPVDGSPPRQVVREAPGSPMQWSAEGKFVYLWHDEQFNRVDRLDLTTGRTELWKEFRPADLTGVEVVQPLLVAPDGKSYVYTYVRVQSDLYLVDGLR
jgi:Tol biopolymer transport system component